MWKLLQIIGQPYTFLIKSIVIFILFLTKLTSSISVRIRYPKLPPIRFPKLRFNLLALFIFVLINVALLAYQWYLTLPSPTLLENPPSQTTKILDRDGNLLYQIYRDENRSLVKLSELPPHLIQATIAIEDKTFYTHSGLDLLGITRAFFRNLKNCRFYTTPCTQEGGSTITQQLIKNTLLSPTKSLDRKLKEAVLAILVERNYSKAQILELYLNEVNYGSTAYGIQAASQYYFNKDAKDLTLEESALLAGLTISPTTLSPLGSRPYLAKERQTIVLRRMGEDGYITSEQERQAASVPLVLHPNSSGLTAPHFVMWLKEQLVDKYGEDLISQGGLTITTTLDLTKQKVLEDAINQELIRLNNLKVSNAAGLITNPQTGDILAMVGSHDYEDYAHDGQVNITIRERQPGSSIKPITYALAFSSGANPGNTIEDSPICFTQKGSEPYCPKNYDGNFHGTITLRTALGSSYNVPAVKLLNSLGIQKMIELAKQMGITSWQDSSRFGLSLTLGGGEIRMVDMAEVYGTFATGGLHTPLRSILVIKDSNGTIIYAHDQISQTQVLSPAVAFAINNILADNNARSPAFGKNSILYVPKQQVAVKTGTTNNLRDNWTFGYTKDILVATWVGNNDNTPMSQIASGITGASPIWRHTIDKLLDPKNPHVFSPPKNSKKVALCKETKSLYCQGICPSAPIYEYYLEGTEPKGNCNNTGSILKEGVSTTQ